MRQCCCRRDAFFLILSRRAPGDCYAGTDNKVQTVQTVQTVLNALRHHRTVEQVVLRLGAKPDGACRR